MALTVEVSAYVQPHGVQPCRRCVETSGDVNAEGSTGNYGEVSRIFFIKCEKSFDFLLARPLATSVASGNSKLEYRNPNGEEGMSDIEGKAARVAARERGQRTSFKQGSNHRMRKLPRQGPVSVIFLFLNIWTLFQISSFEFPIVADDRLFIFANDGSENVHQFLRFLHQ